MESLLTVTSRYHFRGRFLKFFGVCCLTFSNLASFHIREHYISLLHNELSYMRIVPPLSSFLCKHINFPSSGDANTGICMGLMP